MRFAFFFGIGGSFLAVAIPRFLEEVRLSKVAEASEMLEEIHRRAASYFAEAQDPKGRKRCLPPRAGPTPSEIGPQAQKVDFFEKTLPDHETWEALGFNPTRPIRFRYSFIPTQSGCDLHAPEHSYILTYRAQGDLDGDGDFSLFERRDTISPDGTELVPVGILYTINRTE